MAGKPNFTTVVIQGNDVVVNGVSPEDAKDREAGVVDLLGIAVTLEQDNHVAIGVAPSNESWVATLADEAVNFTAGQDAQAVGVEFRRENTTITTWSQTVTITE
jgi:hypothetical protein